MKLGILTFHDGFNHGAYLQCYSLHKYLEKNGFENVIINYKNLIFTYNEYRCFLLVKNPLNFYNNVRKIIKFKQAHKHLKRTKRIFTAKSLEKIYFDIVIIGSDSVWNYNNELSKFDPVYFSKGLRTKRLFSYAASFGPDSYGDKYPPIITYLLNKFDRISVRDVNSQKIVKSITGQKATMVLDPTFLYDFNEEAIECKYDNYILIYSLGLEEYLIQEVLDLAHKKNKKMISIGYENKWADINIVSICPFEWLGFIKNADYIITSMYHGTLFSIKYNKQFSAIITPDRKNKLNQFLTNLSLENRLIDQPGQIIKNSNEDINYINVNNTIYQQILISKKFIKDILTDENNT